MKKTLIIATLLTFAASAVFAAGVFENFNSFANGNLGGQGNWVKGDSGTSWIQIENGMVKIVGGSPGGDRTVGNEISYSGMTGTIYVEFDILAAAWQNTSWSVLVDDTQDTTPDGDMARAYGSAGSVRGRIDGTALVTNEVALASGWNHVKIVINTAANTSTFYNNNVLLTGTNPLNHSPATDILSRISFHKVNGGQTVYLDNLWVGNTEYVVPEPASMLALLTGLVGIVGVARRRR